MSERTRRNHAIGSSGETNITLPEEKKSKAAEGGDLGEFHHMQTLSEVFIYKFKINSKI